jgi:hypothetical protein
VDGDGKLDLLIDATNSADWAKNPGILEVGVLLGNGDGTFKKPVYSSLGASFNSSPFFLADVNGDGKPDLLAGTSVYLNAGGGSFAAGSALTDGGFIAGIGDFNGDGFTDAAVLSTDYPGGTGCEAGLLQIVYGSRTGAFSAGPTFQLPTYAASLAVGDFDGDHHLDLALAFASEGAPSSTNYALVYRGDGSGSFIPDPLQYPLDDEIAFGQPLALDLQGAGNSALVFWTSGASPSVGRYPSGAEVLLGR